jgi:molybdopterin converting factor small subunit
MGADQEQLRVQFLPPLDPRAGGERILLSLPGETTIGHVIELLAERLGPQKAQRLYDQKRRVIPGWCVFLNGKVVRLNSPEGLSEPVKKGDELVFLLNVAGG